MQNVGRRWTDDKINTEWSTESHDLKQFKQTLSLQSSVAMSGMNEFWAAALYLQLMVSSHCSTKRPIQRPTKMCCIEFIIINAGVGIGVGQCERTINHDFRCFYCSKLCANIHENLFLHALSLT